MSEIQYNIKMIDFFKIMKITQLSTKKIIEKFYLPKKKKDNREVFKLVI